MSEAPLLDVWRTPGVSVYVPQHHTCVYGTQARRRVDCKTRKSGGNRSAVADVAHGRFVQPQISIQDGNRFAAVSVYLLRATHKWTPLPETERQRFVTPAATFSAVPPELHIVAPSPVRPAGPRSARSVAPSLASSPSSFVSSTTEARRHKTLCLLPVASRQRAFIRPYPRNERVFHPQTAAKQAPTPFPLPIYTVPLSRAPVRPKHTGSPPLASPLCALTTISPHPSRALLQSPSPTNAAAK